VYGQPALHFGQDDFVVELFEFIELFVEHVRRVVQPMKVLVGLLLIQLQPKSTQLKKRRSHSKPGLEKPVFLKVFRFLFFKVFFVFL